MENLTIQPCIRPSQEDELISSSLFCPGFLKLPPWPLKSKRWNIRRRSSKIIPIVGEGGEDSSSLPEAEQSKQIPTVTSPNDTQRKQCWEEEDNTCSNAGSGESGRKNIAKKYKQLSASLRRVIRRSKHADVETPVPAASGSIETEKNCNETSRPCSLLLRVMTTSHALFNDIMSILRIWKVVCKKPFSSDCNFTQTQFMDNLTKAVRKRIKKLVQELRKQAKIVDEMLRTADEAASDQSFKSNFKSTDEYIKEFTEIASKCHISKILEDFAQAVSAIQTLINKCSSLSDHLSALSPNIASPVNDPSMPTDGKTVKEQSLEQQLLKLIRELSRHRKTMLFITDEVKILDRKLEKQAKRDRQKALRKQLGRQKCSRSNRVVAKLHMAKIPMIEVVNIMPSIEEE